LRAALPWYNNTHVETSTFLLNSIDHELKSTRMNTGRILVS